MHACRSTLEDPTADSAEALSAGARCFGHAAARELDAASKTCRDALRGLDSPGHAFRRSLLRARLRWALGRLLLDAAQPAAAQAVLAEAVQLLDAAGDPERTTALIDPLLALAEAARARGDTRIAAESHARARRIAAAQARLAPHYRELLRRASAGPGALPPLRLTPGVAR